MVDVEFSSNTPLLPKRGRSVKLAPGCPPAPSEGFSGIRLDSATLLGCTGPCPSYQSAASLHIPSAGAEC
ncbi:hypothetical protein PGT21_032576 [Puccinia graminis f. sp. tritici]|uniref:Uncharacterized protein n=1 Tax=Puccinia graminis f. sp. tritici TaxID=56615 RepID=A0A5B0M097_PUCGR|nr:hypothetical protein PGT21_032576 [Puccinia graminis f. sp. tritici]